MNGEVMIREEDFSIDDLKKEVQNDNSGAVVIFDGIVRANNEGAKIRKMEVQRYEDMTEQELDKVKEEAVNNFEVEKILIVHRYGRFDVGDNIVGIAVASEHRKEAFDACRYCIDRLKEKVPLWKKEITETGEEKWVEGEDD